MAAMEKVIAVSTRGATLLPSSYKRAGHSSATSVPLSFFVLELPLAYSYFKILFKLFVRRAIEQLSSMTVFEKFQSFILFALAVSVWILFCFCNLLSPSPTASERSPWLSFTSGLLPLVSCTLFAFVCLFCFVFLLLLYFIDQCCVFRKSLVLSANLLACSFVLKNNHRVQGRLRS